MAAKRKRKTMKLSGLVDEETYRKATIRDLMEFHRGRADLAKAEVAHFQQGIDNSLKSDDCKGAVKNYARAYGQLDLAEHHLKNSGAPESEFDRLFDTNVKAFSKIVSACEFRKK